MSMKSSTRPAGDELDRLVALGITRQQDQVEAGDDCLDCLDPEVLASYADGGLSVEERAEAEAHLAACRDCRRALALLIESDPVVASPVADVNAAAAATATMQTAVNEVKSGTFGTRGESRDKAGLPRLVKSAAVWLPLAAAVVVATGLWFAFDGARKEAAVTSEPAQFSARNEPSALAAKQSAVDRSAAPQAAAPQPREEASRISSDDDAKRIAPPPAHAEVPAAGQAPAEVQAPLAARAREARRDGYAAAARPNSESDRRAGLGPRPAEVPAPAAAPPPPPAALADAAAPARAGGAAGREAQTTVAGQIAPSAPASPSAPPALAPSQAAAANQAGQQANQNTQQQALVNQQTGPMSNLNVAPPPPKTDERRQAERAKGERAENEKSSGSAPGAKPTEIASAKPAEAPKALARAKTAPENAAAAAPTAPAPAAAAPTPAEATQAKANAESGGASPTFRSTGAGAASGTTAAATPNATSGATAGADRNAAARGAGGAAAAGAASGTTAAATPNPSSGATTGADRSAASRGAVDAARAGGAAGARPADASVGALAESVTVITAAPAPGPVLRSLDGARWWRIRAPSTIEGSGDRGATWTVEYSEPSARLVRGAAAAKGGCWMIGANGLVLRTRPAGGWERVAQPTTRNLVTLTATDHLIATVTDDQGRSYRTIDGGATWR
jgi:hypothetical protein